MRDSLSLDVVVERTAPTKWGYSLSGRVAGGSVGFVTLVAHEEAVAGTIWTSNSAYELKHMAGGVHTLREVTNAQPLSCAAGGYSDITPAGALARSGDDDGSVVDILIVWTPAYEERSGSTQDVLLHIEMLIAHINDAFDRSGALVSLNLVGAQKLDEDSFLSVGGEFMRLANPNDGYWDEVHDWRDAQGADLVHMLTTALGRPRAGGAFGIGGHNPRTFAHEIGHNMGLRHERAEINEMTSGLGGPMSAYDYGFSTGFREPTNRDARDCGLTFMSYGNRCGSSFHYLPFYASPWRYHPEDGRPLGVSRFSRERGIRGPADAVLAINRNRHSVANLRHKP